MNIEFESSQQQDINDTPITQLDETCENGSDSNFIFEKVRWSISIKPTLLKISTEKNVTTERNLAVSSYSNIYGCANLPSFDDLHVCRHFDVHRQDEAFHQLASQAYLKPS